MDIEQERMLFFRIRNGDKEAFSALYREYRTPVYTILIRIVGSRETAEDLLHDLFLRLFEAPPGEEVRNTRAWIFRMARNLAIDSLRTAHPSEELDETIPGADGEIETSLDLASAMRYLPPAQRELVTLHAVLGLSFTEITQITGRSLPSVWRGYQSAIGLLRKRMNGGN